MERNYIIPLRKEFQKAPVYKKAQKAAYAAKEFLQKHMKMENVKLGRHLNMRIWQNGPRNPPAKVEVHVEIIKDKDGDYAYAELVGKKKEALKPIVVEKAKGLAGKIESVVGSGKDEKKAPKKEADKKAHKKESEEKVKAEVLKKGESPKSQPVEEKVAKEEKKEVQEMKREEKIVTRDKKE
jgi:ribosomal protein L31E